MFYEYHVCEYIDLNVKGNQQHLKAKKKDQEEVLDQEALKDQNIRKDKNAEIGHMAGKDQVAVKKDQVAVKKDQEDQNNIDQ